MRNDFKWWLKEQGYADNTCVAQMHRVHKVEQYYGSLDQILSDGRFDALIRELTYTMEDERRDKPNPSKIEFNGNTRNNLASYKNSAQRYAKFWAAMKAEGGVMEPPDIDDLTDDLPPEMQDSGPPEPEKQRLALERDMQNALRRDITALHPDLSIIDNGAEHRVASGSIDILCQDANGTLVVIELKAGVTDTRVLSQILGYMGDLMEERPDHMVRGIIVAHEFDRRTRAASRAVSTIQLMSYDISFTFSPDD